MNEIFCTILIFIFKGTIIFEKVLKIMIIRLKSDFKRWFIYKIQDILSEKIKITTIILNCIFNDNRINSTD